jgi:hypothetical protein
MNTLAKLSLVAVTLFATATAQAEMVSGYLRQNGTYVAPYYRTQANGTPYDNLSYRGYRSQQPGYVSPSASSYGSTSGFRSGYSRRAANDSTSAFTPRVPSFRTFGESGQALPNRSRSFRSFTPGE